MSPNWCRAGLLGRPLLDLTTIFSYQATLIGRILYYSIIVCNSVVCTSCGECVRDMNLWITCTITDVNNSRVRASVLSYETGCGHSREAYCIMYPVVTVSIALHALMSVDLKQRTERRKVKSRKAEETNPGGDFSLPIPRNTTIYCPQG